MHDSMIGASLAMKAMRAEVTSAQPGSPVVPDRRPPRTPVTNRARTALARGLMTLAARVQPSDRSSVPCGAGAR